MKKLFLLCGLLCLLATTGCIIADGGRRGHGRGEAHAAVIVPVPVVVVPAVRIHAD